MKNLFSINKTHDRNAMDFDPTPYLAATVSEEVKAKLQNAFAVLKEDCASPEPTAEEVALRKKSNRYWLASLVCVLSGFALFFAGGRLGIYESMPVLYVPDLALVFCALFLNFKAKKINRQQAKLSQSASTVDFSEASKLLTEAAAEASRELGVPKLALTTDVFTYPYKLDGDKTLRVGRKGKFDNLSVSVFVKDKKLCFATSQELLAVPLSEITGYREYDEDFELDIWLKPEEPDSDKYKAFGIRKSGFLSHKGHGYFGLLIGQNAYEVLIPCYDFAMIKELLERNGVKP